MSEAGMLPAVLAVASTIRCHFSPWVLKRVGVAGRRSSKRLKVRSGGQIRKRLRRIIERIVRRAKVSKRIIGLTFVTRCLATM